jgi:putative glycosyltransferase
MNKHLSLSVVTTLYKSKPFIVDFYNRICAEAKIITEDYEIIFVNDGSPDDSLRTAIQLCDNDPAVKVVDLTRNFGHHKAIMAGLRESAGDMVFLIDVDLEEKPELLGKFYEVMKNNRSFPDVVYGIQETRKGGLYRRLGGYLFFKLFNFFSDEPIPTNMCLVRLMNRKYVNDLLRYEEAELLLGGIFLLAGGRQLPLLINKDYKGSTTYSISRKIAMSITGLTSFSSKPLFMLFYAGFFITLFSVFTAFFLIANKIRYGADISGWTSIMLTQWFLMGLMIFAIGLLGMYVGKIYNEVKRRPRYLIKKVYTRNDKSSDIL